MSGISAAFAAAAEVIAAHSGAPTPLTGLVEAQVGDWKLAINASAEPVARPLLDPWTIWVENTRYLIVGFVAPWGGMIGGMSEADFIAEMGALGGQA